MESLNYTAGVPKGSVRRYNFCRTGEVKKTLITSESISNAEPNEKLVGPAGIRNWHISHIIVYYYGAANRCLAFRICDFDFLVSHVCKRIRNIELFMKF